MTPPETQDPVQESLVRLERALNRLEVAAKTRMQSLALARSHDVDLDLLNADRQALAQLLDEEKAAKEASDRLRAQALEKVDGAMEMIRAVLYEAAAAGPVKEGANR